MTLDEPIAACFCKITVLLYCPTLLYGHNTTKKILSPITIQDFALNTIIQRNPVVLYSIMICHRRFHDLQYFKCKVYLYSWIFLYFRYYEIVIKSRICSIESYINTHYTFSDLFALVQINALHFSDYYLTFGYLQSTDYKLHIYKIFKKQLYADNYRCLVFRFL